MYAWYFSLVMSFQCDAMYGISHWLCHFNVMLCEQSRDLCESGCLHNYNLTAACHYAIIYIKDTV